jgi:hypothetical protein
MWWSIHPARSRTCGEVGIEGNSGGPSLRAGGLGGRAGGRGVAEAQAGKQADDLEESARESERERD